VDLQAKSKADCLLFTGDLIHAESAAGPDDSLAIVADVIGLQDRYGEAVIYLCGNHELPHIYGFGLSKGGREYTPGFEAALTHGGRRAEVTRLFQSLPLFVRTAAGVALTHAGAAGALADLGHALTVFGWKHEDALAEATTRLAAEELPRLRQAFARLSQADSYEALVRHYLAVIGEDDPRYDDLLRGLMATSSLEFQYLYESVFTRCERADGLEGYAQALSALLGHLSAGYARQVALVAGHLSVQNGCEIIADRHLRLASGSHAHPREQGLCLLFDAAVPIEQAADLLPGRHSVYAA
jgi:hypothetical protein